MKRNNLIIRLAAAVCTLAFLCAAYFTSVSAVSGFDKDRKCSITITMLDSKSKTPVGDGTMTLYHVGDIDESMNFILMGDFKNSGISLSDLSDRKKAEELISFVKSNSKIKGTTRSIDSNGVVRFASLSCGLYLLSRQPLQTEDSP